MKRSAIITTLIVLLGVAVFTAFFLLSRKNIKPVKTVEKSAAETPGDASSVTDAEEVPLKVGWQENESGDKIYFNLDGTLANGWTDINGFTYYFNDDGTPYSGWLTDLGNRYYIKENGQIKTGLSKINDQYYTFGNDGRLITPEELTDHIDEIPLEEDTVPSKKTVSDNQVYTFGGFELDFEDKKALFDVIGQIDPDGYRTIGFIMINLGNGKGIGYNVDEKVYSASCIKGPYVASLVSSKPEMIETNSNTLTEIIMNSDNKLYSNLRKTYGREHFAKWCQEADVDEDVSVYNYPYLSSRNLAKLWVKNYYFFNTDEVGMQIKDWYIKPNASAIYSSLGKGGTEDSISLNYRTESKAGWFCESGKPTATATTDGGIIYPDSGAPYVIAIITDLPSDMESLEPLCLELNEIYKKTK